MKYWRHALAIIVCLVVAGLFYAGYDYLRNVDRQPYADYGYQPARDRTAPAAPKDARAAPPAYQPNCDRPQSGDDSDLCAQWAAVQAVSEGNRLTRVSTLITGLEFAALVASLLFTGWAAFAAVRAARAAEKSVEHGALSAFQQLRAYLDIAKTRVKWDKEFSDILLVKLDIVNCGQTPARNVQVSLNFHVDDSDTNSLREIGEETLHFDFIGPQRKVGITRGFTFLEEEKRRLKDFSIYGRCEIKVVYTLYNGDTAEHAESHYFDDVDIEGGRMSIYNQASVKRQNNWEARQPKGDAPPE